MNELKMFLQAFSTISDEEFEESKTHFREVHLKKGDFLIQEGEICKEIAFIKEGSLRTYYFSEKGEEVTACFRSKNSLVSSYTSFILQNRSFLSITTLEDSALLVLDYDTLQNLYNTSMTWQSIGRLMAEQEYINMEQYASTLNVESAKEKYLRLMEEQPEVIKKSNMGHIATYLGVTVRTLSRIRKEISV